MKNKILSLLTIATVGSLLAACGTDNTNLDSASSSSVLTDDQQKAAKIWPKLDIQVKQNSDVEKRVANLLATMTLEQKIAQMIQPEIRDMTVEDMRKYGFGSYLNGGGAFPNDNKQATPQDWVNLAESLYQASIDDSLDGSSIPTMWGTDAVHGHNNVVGATLFPHNIGLGAANNPDLIEDIANATAPEVLVTGIDWVFAPTVAVVRDDRWGRTYESYSEDPEIVRAYSASIVSGLQGGSGSEFLDEKHVISTVKHFVGDGGTVGGDDQGNNIADEQTLFDIHAQGYVGGLTVGAQSVMASFNSWHGDKIHGNKYLLTTVLKDTMGFDGFVVGDWNGHGQIKGCSNESCPQAINAGLDIFMAPTQSWKPLYYNTIEQVKTGVIPMSRIDDAVTRILRVKVRAGLFEKPSPKARALAGKNDIIGQQRHRAIARQAVQESLVLLKNNNGVLPLNPQQNILVAGDAAHNIGKQSGGWTITWQGTGNKNSDFPGGSSIYDGIKSAVELAGGTTVLSVDGTYSKKPDVAVVVFGEEPYAEGNGDLDNLEYQRLNKTDLALLQKLKADGIPVVSVFITGRPLWVNAELNASDAFVVAWLPGSEGQGVADVLVGDKDGKALMDFKGRLSFSWPANAQQATVNVHDEDYAPLFPYGYGLTYDVDTQVPQLNEESAVEVGEINDLVIMQGTIKAPMILKIGAGADSLEMNSSVLENNTVHVRTIDKVVQEDARKVSFKGNGIGRVAIGHAFPTDLSSYVEGNGMLVFKALITKPLEFNTFKLGMDCDSSCSQGVDLSSFVDVNMTNQWQTVEIPLQCFTEKGTNLTKVFEPFVIQSKSESSLSFADISIAATSSSTKTINCKK